ncbi:MAG: hypothetical protein OEQ39_02955 [Gammaproteobacteria bacterium]|nr:hypothetical protein [Gammaproteobacteria bacterium]MDH3375909.1 hypothetical protein [Gammaproteobacteria bacterium]
MLIIIDTREQSPWAFPPDVAETRRGTLLAGDYALAEDNAFAIERKSIDDFCGTVSSGWARFLRELDRMQLWPARVIIIEGQISDLAWGRHNHSRLTYGFLAKRIAELTMRNVTCLFCENSDLAAGIAWKILKERERQLTL